LTQERVLLLELRAAVLERLRHHVERARQLADLARAALLEAQRKVAAGEARRPDGDVAHRPRDRACEQDAEEHNEGGARDQAGDA
jgi:hypothetical protein